MIIFDATYLVVMFHPNPAPAKDREDKPVSQFKERVAALASKLDVSNEVIGIPTPAMAEVLVRAGNANARAGYVTTLSDTWKFQLLPFDSRAAIEAAELIAKIKLENKSQPWETWAKVKFDVQISAIAKAESATIIYSDDKDIENQGKRLKIPVVRICDLPLPPPPEPPPIDAGSVGTQMDLLTATRGINLGEDDNPEVAAESAADARRQETDNQVQDDPAHPTPVRGSDKGHARDEAAGETKEEPVN